jgi:hypothetical protein
MQTKGSQPTASSPLLSPSGGRNGGPARRSRKGRRSRSAVALLEGKAPPQELDEYKRFIVNLADKVARAHRESGRGDEPVSDTERAATAAIGEALG